MPSRQLDEIDYAILGQLQEHARISNVDLADRVGLSPAPCLRRVQTLEKDGIVGKYVTLLNPTAVKSSFALRQVKYSTALPLPGRNQRDAVQLRQLPHRTGRAKA
jgi:DNA-binding Lrp family transcriptional regulator